MILIGIGANLPCEGYASPKDTCEAALDTLHNQDAVRVMRRSRWFESAPVPVSDQPWYVNGACSIETELSPDALLAVLHNVEAQFGRERGAKNAPRVLDLDLLVYNDFSSPSGSPACIPHPRMHERAFVLLPLRDLVPGWVHPRLGMALDDLIAALSSDQFVRPMENTHAPEDDPFDDFSEME